MSQDVSAGRLHLDVIADTSGFAREAKAKIDAEVKNLRAKIKVELDTRGIITEARAAARTAALAATAKIKAEIDSRGLQAQVRQEAAAASKVAKVKIGAEIDRAKFAADLTASVAALSNRFSVSVGVDVDTAAATARLAAFKAAQRGLPIQMGVNVNMGNLTSVISQFAKIPAMAGGIFVLGAALSNVVMGLGAITASAAQSAVALAVLPNLLGVIAQGGAALMVGLSGVGEGVAALGQAETASAGSAQKAADVRVDSARRVADAQEQLKEAVHSAADAQRQAAYSITDAEWGLARSKESAKRAEDALTLARKNAKQRVIELDAAIKRSALNAENASNSLAKAKQRLADVLYDKSSTGQERADAALDVKNAEAAAKDAEKSQADLRKEADKASKDGAKGSEEVKAAREALRDANHSLMLSERQLREARHSAADASAQGAKQIKAAQRAIQDAHKGGTAAIAAQNVSLAKQKTAFDELSPAAKMFARFLFDTVMPRFKVLKENVQAALLPPLQEGITKAMPLVNTLETGLIGAARVVGRLAIKVGELFGSEGFNDNTSKIMRVNNRALELFGEAAINIIAALSDIAVVAGPTLLLPFARWVKKLSEGWRESAAVGRETGTMKDRFDRARKSVSLLVSIMGNLAGALHGLGAAATPAGDDLLNTFDKVTDRWNTWANSDEGKKKVQDLMATAKPVFEEFGTTLANISSLFIKMGETGGGPALGALKAINWVLEGLNKILGTPYLGTAVGWLLTLAGAAGGLGLVAGMIFKMGSAIALLARITGITAMFRAFMMTTTGIRLGLMALRVQALLVSRVMPFIFGPWGAAIAVAIGLFVLLYKKVGWFRNAVQAAMRGVMAAFGWVVDKAKWLWDVLFGHSVFPDIVDGLMWFVDMAKKAFGFIADHIDDVGKVFNWLWKNAVKPAIDFIGKAVTWLWKNAVGPAFNGIKKVISVWWTAVKIYFNLAKAAIRVIGKVVTWLWKNAIAPAFNGIKKVISVWWSGVKVYFNFAKTAFRAVGEVVKWLWKNAIAPAFGAIKRIISVWWSGVKVYMRAFRAILNAVGGVVRWLWKNAIAPAFNGIKKVISVWWSGVKTIFNFAKEGFKAVGAVAKWLWDKGIKPAFNNIKTGINTVWTFLRDKVFTPLKNMMEKTIVGAFRTAKGAIDRIWSGLKKIAGAPVKFVVETIWNNGLRKVINAIPGLSDIDPVSTKDWSWAKGTSSVLPGYTPGRDVHNFVSRDGKMGLNLSGGEGILRPEVVRSLGPKAIDYINGAARKGGSSLRNAMGWVGSAMGSAPVSHGRADGGMVPKVRKSMSYWLGGVMPLKNASASAHPTGKGSTYEGYKYAGDLNYPGRADYGKPIVAWKAGTVSSFDMGDTSYGRGQTIATDGGGSQMYAHMSKVLTRLSGTRVDAGTTIGYVGDYGNTGNPPTSHLHFEVRNGGINLADGSKGGGEDPRVTAAVKKSKDQESGWRAAISAIKNVVTVIPGKIKSLLGMDGWGKTMKDAAGNLGYKMIDWANKKIPNKISIPWSPDIPLPANPIPNPFKFDSGGDWNSGTAGVNLSGQTETVFTNRNIVDLTRNLGNISLGLRSQVTDPAAPGGQAMIGEVTFNGTTRSDAQGLLADLNHRMKLISLGGVHARTAP